ncbi:MAG: hypothetical protein COB93_07980 [Sneathiella sp.]|nr:MAG: hypothetical protein COB93_07980 [Sneathiella sp.]
MINPKEVFYSLLGAYHLAKRDPDALRYFNISTAGFFSSFAAMLIALPFFTLENAIDYASFQTETGLLPFLFILCIALIVNWAAYLLVVGVLAKYLDFADKFSVFAVVYNWSQLAIIILWCPLSILLTGLLGAENIGMFQLIFMMATYVYLWYILRVTLALSGSLALGFAFLEFLLTLITQFAFANLLFSGAA